MTPEMLALQSRNQRLETEAAECRSWVHSEPIGDNQHTTPTRDELLEQRDTARDWAVRLEQENAHLLEQLEEAAAGERLELR